MSFDTEQHDTMVESEQPVHNDEPFYCPGCGRRYGYQRECTGRGEAPHPAIEVVSTDELHGDDTSKHTAAPNTGE